MYWTKITKNILLESSGLYWYLIRLDIFFSEMIRYGANGVPLQLNTHYNTNSPSVEEEDDPRILEGGVSLKIKIFSSDI